MTIPEIQQALLKRGFALADARPHDCPACAERAVGSYALRGAKLGGRQIDLCLACGKARSWRSSAGLEERTEDTAFNIQEFLR